MTTTVCAVAHVAVPNVSVTVSTVPAVVCPLITPIDTSAVGRVASATVNAAVVLASSLTRSVVVCAPSVVGSVSTVRPAMSSSIVLTATVTDARPW